METQTQIKTQTQNQAQVLDFKKVRFEIFKVPLEREEIDEFSALTECAFKASTIAGIMHSVSKNLWEQHDNYIATNYVDVSAFSIAFKDVKKAKSLLVELNGLLELLTDRLERRLTKKWSEKQ
jgi:hypothetical protein